MTKSFSGEFIENFNNDHVEEPTYDSDEYTYLENCLTYCVNKFFKSCMGKYAVDKNVTKTKLLLLELNIYNSDIISQTNEYGYCSYDGEAKIHIKSGYISIELVAHELAHAIEFIMFGKSDHGDGFNRINLLCGGNHFKTPDEVDAEGEEWKNKDSP